MGSLADWTLEKREVLTAVRALPGLTNYVPTEDDVSSDVVQTGFLLNIAGATTDQLFVNNNGNITFATSASDYTPDALLPLSIAPYFADVDTRSGGGIVRYGTTTLEGRTTFAVTWEDVGYYALNHDLTNTFQLLLIEREDVGVGAFDIEFNCDRVQWETGDASGGTAGLGGTSARVGFALDTITEVAGSNSNGALLDNNSSTGLIHNSLNSTVPGRYIWQVAALPNIAPNAFGDSFTLNEDETLTIATPGVLANDTDINENSLSASVVTGPTHGTLTLSANGGFSYTPEANWFGEDSFTYLANDGSLDSESATVTLVVQSVNDAPTFTSGNNVSVDEDSGAYSAIWATALIAGPADEAGQSLTFTTSNNNNDLFAEQPTLAADGTLTFTPADNANGGDLVTVTLSDDGGTENGGVNESARTFTITVDAVNDAPVLTLPIDQMTLEDTPLVFSGLSMDDLDAGTALVNVSITVTHGTISLSESSGVAYILGTGINDNEVTIEGTRDAVNIALGTVTFTPEENYFSTTDGERGTIAVTVNDLGNTGAGGALTAEGVIYVGIASVNTGPTMADIATQTTPEGQAVNLQISASDIDVSDILVYYADGLPAGLGLHLFSGAITGTIDSTAAELNGGIYLVSIFVSDGEETASKSFTWNITDVNLAPTPKKDVYGGLVNATAPVIFDVLANDLDPDGDPLTLIQLNGADLVVDVPVGLASGASILFTQDGKLAYTALTAAFTGFDTFEYTVSDGALSATVTVIAYALPLATVEGDAEITPPDLPDLDVLVPFTIKLLGATASVTEVAYTITVYGGENLDQVIVAPSEETIQIAVSSSSATITKSLPHSTEKRRVKVEIKKSTPANDESGNPVDPPMTRMRMSRSRIC